MKGSCLCGGVRVNTKNDPNWVAHCHCCDCRKATGAPFATYAGYAVAAVQILGNSLKRVETSPGVFRSFCSECGSSITFEGEKWPGEVHLLISVMDDPNAFSPQAHVCVSESPEWLHLADGLPRYQKFLTDG